MSDTLNPYADWLQVAGGNRAPNHYELLGLALFESDPEQIRSRYWDCYEKVRAYEVGNYTERAVALLEELSQAFQCLTDPDGKRQYDERLRQERALTTTLTGEAVTETINDVPVAAAPKPQTGDAGQRQPLPVESAAAGNQALEPRYQS